MDGFKTAWNSPWAGVVILVIIVIVCIIFFSTKEDKKASFSPYGGSGGNDNLKNGGDSDQPGYSKHVPPGPGVSALLCGGKGSPASKLSGAALEVNLLGAMDDYMSASDIALDKSIGSIYTAGTGSSS